MSSVERRGFADQLSIETPEQVALQFPVAGLGSRFVALLLDHLLQFGALLALVLVMVGVGAAGGHRANDLPGKWFLAGFTLVVFLLLWGYFSLFEAFWHGQTPGKRAMHLRVIKDTGRQITLFEALARNLLRFADYLPSLYLAGTITMLANRRNKRLGDLAAGTLVIHERQEGQTLLWSQEPARHAREAEAAFPADAVARLTARDLAVIETFFARALDLPLDTRASMAYRILGELSRRMGISAPEGNPERALETLAAQLRGVRLRP